MRRFRTKNLTEQETSSYPELAPSGDQDIPGAEETNAPKVLKISETFIDPEDFTVWQEVQAGAEGELGAVTHKVMGPNGKLLIAYGEDGKPLRGGDDFNFLVGSTKGKSQASFAKFIADAFGLEYGKEVSMWNAGGHPSIAGQFGGKPAGPGGTMPGHQARDARGNPIYITHGQPKLVTLTQDEAIKQGYKPTQWKMNIKGNEDGKIMGELQSHWQEAITNLSRMSGDFPQSTSIAQKMAAAKKTYAGQYAAPFGTA